MMSVSSLKFARRAAPVMAAAVAALFNTGFKDVFTLSGPQSTFETAGPVARAQLDVFYVTLWVTSIIFVIVAAVLAYATLKFKVKDGAANDAPPPPQGHGNPLIEIGLIMLSVLALVFIAVPTLKNIWYTYDVPEAEKATAYEVNAIGYQWWFRFDYPTEKIQLPNGGGESILTTANELVIPANRAVRINLRTVDVIHSFWVPKLAGKVDMIPNRANHLWLKADAPGYFWGQCAELCGESHAVMRFRVIALSEADFATWLASQKQPAANTAPAADALNATFATYKWNGLPERNAPGYTAAFDADPMGNWKKQQAGSSLSTSETKLIETGHALFAAKTCYSCHSVTGHYVTDKNGQKTYFSGTTAPNLTHVGSRSTIAGGLLENSPENLHRWILNPHNVKPGNKMYVGVPMTKTSVMAGYKALPTPEDGKPGYMANPDPTTWADNIVLNDEEVRALVAYLSTLK